MHTRFKFDQLFHIFRNIFSINEIQDPEARENTKIIHRPPEKLVKLCLPFAKPLQLLSLYYLGYHYMKRGPNPRNEMYDLTLLDRQCNQIGKCYCAMSPSSLQVAGRVENADTWSRLKGSIRFIYKQWHMKSQLPRTVY
jgi:hypothetical protein